MKITNKLTPKLTSLGQLPTGRVFRIPSDSDSTTPWMTVSGGVVRLKDGFLLSVDNYSLLVEVVQAELIIGGAA